MKIIHTADWHLGHELHGFNRRTEQDAFLHWLSATLLSQEADVLLIAGDIFDTVNPPAAAQQQLYRFIHSNREKIPHLQTIMIAGNHDSASRLEAPNPLFKQFNVISVGRLPRHQDGGLDFAKILIPLFDKQGNERALLGAIPYLRPADLPSPGTLDGDPLIAGVRQVYEETINRAIQEIKADCGLILSGHCHMQGGDISQLSERRILGGGEHAMPVDLFPTTATYVALGHLHKGQKVGGRDEVRYSGSPLPLSVSERHYKHAVQAITLDNRGKIAKLETVAIPRTVDYLRIPDRGALPLTEALDALQKLSLAPVDPGLDLRPFLEVVIQLRGPEPGLRKKIEDALDGVAVRLASIQALTEGQQKPLADISVEKSLADLQPEEVFAKLHVQKYAQMPEPELKQAFIELMLACVNHDNTAEGSP